MHYKLHQLLILSCIACSNILVVFLITPPNCLVIILQKTYWLSLVLENVRQKASTFSVKQRARTFYFARVKENRGTFCVTSQNTLCSAGRDKAWGSAAAPCQGNASCHPCLQVRNSFISLRKRCIFKDSACSPLPAWIKEGLVSLPCNRGSRLP